MRRKLIIDGNAVYEIDDDCARCKEERDRGSLLQEKRHQLVPEPGEKRKNMHDIEEKMNKNTPHP